MSFRDRPFLELKVPLTWTAAVAVIVAAIIGVALLLSDRRQTFQVKTYVATRNVVDTVAAPVSGVVAAPGRWTGDGLTVLRDYIFAGTQNRELRAQVVELQQWRDRAIALENVNARLNALLGLKTDPPIPMVAAQVVADVRGSYADTRLANAGRDQGIAEGNPAISEHGVVGRVVGVTGKVSRILLLNDVSSRTPVLNNRTNARAILTGDGGPNPKLAYMRGVDPVKEGDRILTSGDGGLFPRGLPVGLAVKGLDGAWRVRLFADDAPIDYVRILLFKDFSQLADQKALATTTVPPLPPAEAAQVAARAMPSPSPSPSAASSAGASAKPAPTVAASVAPPPAPSKPKQPKLKSHAVEPSAPPLLPAAPPDDKPAVGDAQP